MAKTALTTTAVLIHHSLLFFFFLFLITPSTAEIKSLTLDSDTRPMILLEKFGFTKNGHVTISLSSITILSQYQPDLSLIGFFLLSDESHYQVQLEIMQNPKICVLTLQYIHHLFFTFSQLQPPPNNSLNRHFTITSPNEYFLYFANCAPDTSVSMKVLTEMYNLDDYGNRKDFLSAGQTQLPSMFSLFAIAYLVFSVIWIYICRANRLWLHRIHILMGILVFVKAINLICAAEDMHYVKIAGTPHGWDVLFYISRFIRVVLLFMVIVLIGTGWSFLKPFLQEREKKVLMLVIPLQVLANVASIVIGETGPFIKDWVTWNQVFLLVDVICCFAIIFPIYWSISTLRETSKTDGKAARNLAKLQLFKQFYIVVIGFLYFTRIVVFALVTVLAYQYRWISDLIGEAARFLFYAVMFYMFRPVERIGYFVHNEDEEEAAEKVLKDQEFDL